MTVDCTVRAHDGLLVASLSGELSLNGIVRVQQHLLKCLAEQPPALLVDLSGLRVRQPLALAVLSTVNRQAARWPGTPVLFCAAGARTSELLAAAAFRRLLVFGSIDEAVHHIEHGGHGMPSIAENLLPVSGAARRGRDIATEACLQWEVPDLIAAASLICSELISNVVDHAHTLMTLRLSLGRGFLFIAVRDGSAAEPARPDSGPGAVRGRGLHIVDATAHSWGTLPTRDGKVVWASLALP